MLWQVNNSHVTIMIWNNAYWENNLCIKKIFFPKGELVDAYNQKTGEWILDENQSYLNKIPNQEVNKYLSNLSEFTDNDLTIIYITFPTNTHMCFPVQNLQVNTLQMILLQL